MTRDNHWDVGLFHERFGLPHTLDRSGPVARDPELLEFRKKFLQEELDEFSEAVEEDNVAGMADALVDIVYVALGTAHLLGLPWHALWDEVQRANMQKVRAASDGSDSKRGSSWDVVKPPGWTPPDIAMILIERGWPMHTVDPNRKPVDLGKRLLDEEAGEGERREFG